ncbi:hypothetical protein TrRE_jg10288, partial [Triparma retinervis]
GKDCHSRRTFYGLSSFSFISRISKISRLFSERISDVFLEEAARQREENVAEEVFNETRHWHCQRKGQQPER